jgi:hypothetical protein
MTSARHPAQLVLGAHIQCRAAKAGMWRPGGEGRHVEAGRQKPAGVGLAGQMARLPTSYGAGEPEAAGAAVGAGVGVWSGGWGGIVELGAGKTTGNGRPYFCRMRFVVAPRLWTST